MEVYTYIYIYINAIVYVPSEPSQKSNFVGQISVIISVAFQVLSSTDHMTRPSGRKQDSMSPSQCQASIGWTQGGEEGGMVGPSAEKSHVFLFIRHGEELDCIWIYTFTQQDLPNKNMSHLQQL